MIKMKFDAAQIRDVEITINELTEYKSKIELLCLESKKLAIDDIEPLFNNILLVLDLKIQGNQFFLKNYK